VIYLFNETNGGGKMPVFNLAWITSKRRLEKIFEGFDEFIHDTT